MRKLHHLDLKKLIYHQNTLYLYKPGVTSLSMVLTFGIYFVIHET